MAKKQVFIIDRHALTREGLRHLVDTQPDLAFCGGSGCLEDGARQVAALNPDLVVLEPLCHTGMRTDAIQKMRRKYPKLMIFALSMGNDATYAERALAAGANGYLSKDHASADILAGLRRVLAGKVCLCDAVAEVLLKKGAGGPAVQSPEAPPIADFSDRELQIFQLLGKGLMTGAIAQKLKLSVNTIDTYRQRLKAKLGLATGGELNRCAACWVERHQADFQI